MVPQRHGPRWCSPVSHFQALALRAADLAADDFHLSRREVPAPDVAHGVHEGCAGVVRGAGVEGFEGDVAGGIVRA